MAETVSDVRTPCPLPLLLADISIKAVKSIEQGHIRVGPTPVTDPAMLITRPMEDFVTWVDTSARKRTIMKYNDEVGDNGSERATPLTPSFSARRLRSALDFAVVCMYQYLLHLGFHLRLVATTVSPRYKHVTTVTFLS